MTSEEKDRLRPFFATKGAWQRHIASVLKEAALQRKLLPTYSETSWIKFAEYADQAIICFPKREPCELGVDFIRHAELLYDWKHRRGKRLYRRAMERGDLVTE